MISLASADSTQRWINMPKQDNFYTKTVPWKKTDLQAWRKLQNRNSLSFNISFIKELSVTSTLMTTIDMINYE